MEKVLMIIGMMVVIGLVYDFVFWKYLLCYRRDKFLRGLGLDEMVKGGLKYEERIDVLMEKGMAELRNRVSQLGRSELEFIQGWSEKEKLGISEMVKEIKDSNSVDVANQIKDALFKIELSIIQLDNVSRTRIENGVKEVHVHGESQYNYIQNILNKNYERDAAVRKEAFERSVARLEEMVIKAVKEHLSISINTDKEGYNDMTLFGDSDKHSQEVKDLIDPEHLDDECQELSENDPERTEQPEAPIYDVKRMAQIKRKMYTFDDLFNQKLTVRIKDEKEAKLLGVHENNINAPIYPTCWCNSKYREYSRQGDWTYSREGYWKDKGYTIIDFNQVIINKSNDNNSSN